MKIFLLLLLSSYSFADTKISALPLLPGASVGVNDSFPFVNVAGSQTARLKLSTLFAIPSLQNPTFTGTVTANSFIGSIAVGNLSQGTATTGQFLRWNGSAWAPANVVPSFSTVSVAADYTITCLDNYVGVINTAAPRTMTLPLAATCGDGHILYIKDESGNAGTNNIATTRSGSELIDAYTSVSILTNYGVLKLISRNSKWWSL